MKKYFSTLIMSIAAFAIMVVNTQYGIDYNYPTLLETIKYDVLYNIYMYTEMSSEMLDMLALGVTYAIYLALVCMTVALIKWEYKDFVNNIKKIFAKKEEKQKEVHATFIEAD